MDWGQAARTALQQMAHAQEQYKREAEWSAEEETCSGGRNAWHDVADELASLSRLLMSAEL